MNAWDRVRGWFADEAPTGMAADPPRARFGAEFSPDLLAAIGGDPGAVATRISRTEALQVPAVLRGRNLIAGTIGSLPLVTLGPDRAEVDTTYLLGGNIDPDVPNSVLMAYTAEDMLFEGIAWWRVTKFGWHGFPVEARWVPHNSVQVVTATPLLPSQARITEDELFPVNGQVYIDGMPVADRELIRFDSPNPPLLRHAARAIRTALRLDRSSQTYADSPMPLGALVPTDGAEALNEEEINELLDSWDEARRKHAWAYAQGVTPTPLQWSPSDLQLADARQHAVLEISRALGIDPEDLGVSTTSRTYQNAEQRRRDLLDFTLGAYVSAIQDRLSMRDVLPRGYRAKIKFDGFLRSDTLTRYQAYEVGLATGAITVPEIRVAEDRPALPAAAMPAPIPAAPPSLVPPAAPPGRRDDRTGSMSAFSEDTDQTVTVTFDDPDTAKTFAVNANRRMISGVVVPWGKVATSRGRQYRFTEGSLEWSDTGRVKLNMNHDRAQAVGRAVNLESQQPGLRGVFRVARGAGGDEALTLAEDGVTDGFSIEVDILDAEPDPADGNITLVYSGQLKGVALTAWPAFDDARVDHVAAAADRGGTAPAKPYGDVPYADPGYQDDKQKRYPIDTADHVRAAWSYINQAKNAAKYSAAELANIKGRIKAAAKRLGVDIAENSSSGSMAASIDRKGTVMADTAETVDQAPGSVDFDGYMTRLGDTVAESHKELTASLAESIGESVAAGFKSALENIYDPQRDGPTEVRAARFQVTREAPIYTFDGLGPSLVHDAWYASREHDTDAQERLRRFHVQTNEMQKLAAKMVTAFAAERTSAQFTTQTSSNASQIIPPGYRPELFVPLLAHGRPIVSALSMGVISNPAPFVVPTFGTATSMTATQTEGAVLQEGTVTFGSVTVNPSAVAGKLPLSRQIVDSANPGVDQIILAALRESYAQQTEAAAYTELNGANGCGGTITAGFVPSGAQAATVAATGLGQPVVQALRAALAAYPFARFGAPTQGLLGSNATKLFATAIDTTNRPLLPSIGAMNSAGLGNAVTQGWYVDGLPHVPAWSMTGTASGDSQIIELARQDAWAWESPTLAFRFEEKQGPQIIELALFGYFAVRVLRPVGLSGLRIT